MSPPLCRKLFSDADGNLLKTGDILKFEKLADTLEVIANEGPDVFYTGRIAEDLLRDVQEAGTVPISPFPILHPITSQQIQRPAQVAITWRILTVL